MLRDSFVSTLAGWDWHVALLQEAPPRWFDVLCHASEASGALALTSRNSFAPLRAALAAWNPDLIASGEGGSNMLLVRPPWRLAEIERVTLTERPERRRALLGRIETEGRSVVVANMHLSVPNTGHGETEALAAATHADAIAGRGPVLFGGDLNLRPRDHPRAFERLASRHGLAGATGDAAIDHLLSRGLEVAERPRALPGSARDVPGPDDLLVRLSDHAPVLGSFSVR